VAEQFDRVLDFYSRAAGHPLGFNSGVYESEARTGHRNRAIAHMLRSVDALRGDAEEALELYFRQCSIEVTCRDLSMIAATLANSGTNPVTDEVVLDGKRLRRVLSVMATCGMYDAAGDWLTTVGMPAKSGVGGGIFAVLPGQLGIGVYSPRLDQFGHTARGVQACRQLSEVFELHFLAVPRSIRNTIRSVTPHEHAMVYELQGDLLFAGVESVVRQTRDAEPDKPVVILDVIRVDQVSQVAKTILWEFAAGLREDGRELVLVDPDRMFMPDEDSGVDAVLAFDDQTAALEWAASD
jgi:glutaminase